jgi:ATP-dependent exoDNAse (exonuclease V) alpha subunit
MASADLVQTNGCWVGNRGGVGARSLNIELQAALNPAGGRKVERFGWTFAPGDKIMQIENDYDGDIYTSVPRGKQLVVLVGQKKAIAIAVRNDSGRRRWSKLDEWLAAPAGSNQCFRVISPSHRSR